MIGKHIRDNIGYYYHNQDQLKIYLLEKLFSDNIKQYLPQPPKEIESYEWINEIIKNEVSRNLKKDKNHYIKYAHALEDYNNYLTDILDQYGIEYISLEECQEQGKQETEAYFKRLEEAYKGYEEKKNSALLSSRLLT